jgi:two-component system chemotaxis response regulator CheY
VRFRGTATADQRGAAWRNIRKYLPRTKNIRPPLTKYSRPSRKLPPVASAEEGCFALVGRWTTHALADQTTGLNGTGTMTVDMNMTILIVDDYKTMLRIIRNLLKQLGFSNVDEAADGAAALRKLRGKDYNLVISDWNMEPMTGYQLLKEMRSDGKLQETPFIMITAESKTENVIAAKKAGVNNYIVKPFNAATLKTKMTSVIGDF